MTLAYKIKISALSILLLFSTLINLFPNENPVFKYRFRYLTMQDGLSNYKVNTICSDSSGFLWIGTNEGLNRYDGYNFKIFKENPGKENSLINNTIRDIISKSNDELVIATDNGVCIYNSRFDVFNKIPVLGHENSTQIIWSVCLDGYGTTWIGATNGLYYYKEGAEKALPFQIENNWLGVYDIREVETIDDSLLFIGTHDHGLFVYNIVSGDYHNYRNVPGDTSSISGNWIEAIFKDSKGNIWIGTNDNGINLFQYSDSFFNSNFIQRNTLADLRVRDIKEDKNGNIWLGTSSGLFKKPANENDFIPYANTADISSPLNSNSIYDICIDKYGIIWCGTYSGGVNYCDTYQKDFNFFKYSKWNEYYLNDKVVFCICEDENYRWIGTERGGINKYDIKNQTYEYIELRDKGVNSNNIKIIIQDAKNNLWIGTYKGGLVYFDTKTYKVKNYINEPGKNSLHNNIVYTLVFDSDSNLWIGTRDGIDKFDIKNETFYHYSTIDKTDENIQYDVAHKLFFDSNENLWLGDGIHGLLKFNKNKNRFETYDTIFKAVAIYSIFEDLKGNIWAGGNSGLFYVDLFSDTIVHYTQEQGLPINTIFAIEGDKNGNLWLSTAFGITKFNQAAHSPFVPDFEYFTSGDGIHNEQFTINAGNTSTSDEIFFGGVNGYISFYPDKIEKNPILPDVKITNLKLFNKEAVIGEKNLGKLVLKESVSTTKEINLSYKHKVFTIEFAALHYSSPNKNKYRYKLEGFEKEWNYTTAKQRFATYTNLDGGNYRFIVYGSNNDGQWGKTPAVLDIHVAKAYWETTLFRILIVGLISSLVLLIIRVRTISLNKQNQILEEAKRSAEESDRLKSAFLANMSHEIRTPMNAIIGFTNLLAEEENVEEQNKYKELINKNSESLLVLIDDILDISKIDAGQMEIFNEEFDAYQVCSELYEYYKLKNKKHIKLVFENTKKEELLITLDEVRFRQILTNILNNALKYTNEGYIRFGYRLIDEVAQFYVSDTGIGIEKEYHKAIFDHFNKIEDHSTVLYRGTGIGLSISKNLTELMNGKIWVESEPGKGSTFYVNFPIQKTDKKLIKKKDPKTKFNGKSINYNIVIAEDEENNYKLLKKLLENKGINIAFWAKNGKEVVDYIKTSTVNNLLVLMDIKMPVKSGTEALIEIREFNDDIPIIAVTAYATESEKKNFMKYGFNGYIAKPIVADDLLRTLVNKDN